MSSCLYHRTVGKENFITPNTIPRIGNSFKKYRFAKVYLCPEPMPYYTSDKQDFNTLSTFLKIKIAHVGKYRLAESTLSYY